MHWTKFSINGATSSEPSNFLSRKPSLFVVLLYFDISGNTVDNYRAIGNTLRMRLDDAAAHLEALGNPTRLKIYRALVRAGDAGLPVGRLQEKLKIAPSTLSHHIKTLMVVGLITQVRDATTLVCHANYDVMQGLVDFLVAECCSEGAETKVA
jgi:DNA-binding transcriptional ArsR family regulator